MTLLIEPEVHDVVMPQICKKCGSLYEDHTEKTRKCTVCERYRIICANGTKNRENRPAPGIDLTLSDYANWFALQPKQCFYCNISEDWLNQLALRNMVGRYLRRFGVDRLRGGEPYRLDNIVTCCFACNATRSNRLSVKEMRAEIGPSLGRVFKGRIEQVEDMISVWHLEHPGEDMPCYKVVWDEYNCEIALGVRRPDGSGYDIIGPDEDTFDYSIDLGRWAPKVICGQLPLPWFQV